MTKRQFFAIFVLAAAVLGAAGVGFGQVSPAEIPNPQLRALEQEHFEQLIALNKVIAAKKFPFHFVLSRIIDLDPKAQAGLDSRGLEFVKYQNRTVLKISGNYNAAFNADLLTQNQRANRILDDVVTPILGVLPKCFPGQADFDAFGFEISYHVIRKNRHYVYEGKENVVLLFPPADVSAYLAASSEAERQDVINDARVYVDGKEFGLMLGERDPMDLEALGRPAPGPSTEAPKQDTAPLPGRAPAREPTVAAVRLPDASQELPMGLHPPAAPASPVVGNPTAPSPAAALAPADLDALQKQFQPQLDALAKEGAARFHFVAYAPPSLVLFRGAVYLQLTLRNPTPFDKSATSIYKRAAESFDLFLAPQLKDILSKVPSTPEIAGLDITVLDSFAGNTTSTEAIEYASPMQPLRQFTDYAITNQDLIKQSAVLVNGVRIALNLQQVE